MTEEWSGYDYRKFQDRVKHLYYSGYDLTKCAENLEKQIQRGELDLPVYMICSYIKYYFRTRGYDWTYVTTINNKLPTRFKKSKDKKHISNDISRLNYEAHRLIIKSTEMNGCEGWESLSEGLDTTKPYEVVYKFRILH